MLFERQPNESSKAFEAFRLYRDMGPERSAEAVAKKLGKSRKGLDRWSSRFSWVDRARAWDDFLDAKQRAAEAKKLEGEAAKWAARKAEHQNKLWERKVKLEEKLHAMLQFPLAETRTADGRTIVKPTRWTFGEAARLTEAITKLERLAMGLPTDKTEHTGPDGEQIVAPIIQPQMVVKVILPDNGREKKA